MLRVGGACTARQDGGRRGSEVSEFNFERWADLARRDPRAYYRARERAIRTFIDAHPAVQAEGLRELQARIDSLRALAGNPGQATRELTEQLQEHLEALEVALGRLESLAEKLIGRPREPGSP